MSGQQHLGAVIFVRVGNIEERGSSSDRERALSDAAVRLGRRVRELRKERGLTQGQLAERLSKWGRSYHPSTITKLEQGVRPTTFAELTALAAELRVSERDFFDDPSPAEQAAREVREAEQAVLALEADVETVAASLRRVRADLNRALERYARAMVKLREFNPGAAEEREKLFSEAMQMELDSALRREEA